jgi:hypothetical protein
MVRCLASSRDRAPVVLSSRSARCQRRSPTCTLWQSHSKVVRCIFTRQACSQLTSSPDTSDDYRRHLYQTTTLKITKTLESLLHALYESNWRIISSDGDMENPQHSPIRLTVPAKFEREVAKLYLPISQYQIRLTRTNTNGEREKLPSTLETRMLDYVDHIAKKAAEVEKLRKDWETIVGEIWKLGVNVLGEDKMEALLFTNQSALCHSSSPLQGLEASFTALEGSTLFVPEHGTSPLAPGKPHSKKRVTFEDPDDLPSNPSSLQFLYRPSVLKPIRIVHALSERDIEDLETSVEDLGAVHISDLCKIEKEYQEFWSRKTSQLTRLFESDEEETGVD